jgi:predicted DNA-binding transcriptional regulator YafY
LATNKHATIRYHALDRCFSNFGRKFFIDNLIESCNEALLEISGIEDGVKRRQIFDDIAFMESEQGWSIMLERVKEGKRVYYRYEDKSFSIRNQGLNQLEAEQLNETVSILSRFKGLPQFEWVEEIQIRLQDTFHLKRPSGSTVGFAHNPYLKGLNHFTDLFNAIQNKQALRLTYKAFTQLEERKCTFHPWYLKQYNNRWFLFGYNAAFQALSNFALDRIVHIEADSASYVENESIDFDEYFEDIVGVSVPNGGNIEHIQLKVENRLYPYIHTKPIHGSQKLKEQKSAYTIISVDLIPNYEFESLILSLGEGVEVLRPLSFREKIIKRIELCNNRYTSDDTSTEYSKDLNINHD